MLLVLVRRTTSTAREGGGSFTMTQYQQYMKKQEAWLKSHDFHKASSESRPTTVPGLKDSSLAKDAEGRHHPEIWVQKRKHTAHCNRSTATAVGTRHFDLVSDKTLSAYSELLPGKERLRAMLELGQLDQCLSFFGCHSSWGRCRWCVRGTRGRCTYRHLAKERVAYSISYLLSCAAQNAGGSWRFVGLRFCTLLHGMLRPNDFQVHCPYSTSSTALWGRGSCSASPTARGSTWNRQIDITVKKKRPKNETIWCPNQSFNKKFNMCRTRRSSTPEPASKTRVRRGA